MTTWVPAALWRVPMAFLLVAVACGDGEAAERSVSPPPPARVQLPSMLLGLTVEPADIEERLEGAEAPFVDSVGLFTLRDEDDDRLRATLQVSRFTPEARPETEEFRQSIIGGIGQTVPRQVPVGEEQVFVTTGRNQNVFIWFRERGFFVLTVAREYRFPRTLLRRVLELELQL